MKHLLSFLVSILVFLSLVSPIYANDLPQVLIINQVRGTECCDPGTAEVLAEQLDFLTKQKLPAFFTLRWDALNDPNFINIINQADPELFSWGFFNSGNSFKLSNPLAGWSEFIPVDFTSEDVG